MNVDGQARQSIWRDGDVVRVIDQRHLPHQFVVEDLRTWQDCAAAIRDMHIRGAGLIGVTAGFAVWLALRDHGPAALPDIVAALKATRPTAVNLAWAADRVAAAALSVAPAPVGLDLGRAASRPAHARALQEAEAIRREDVEMSHRIGAHGLQLIMEISARKRGAPVHILTHCNAGWLAFVDLGTATAPIYLAYDAGIPIHVWVDETRPRNQGAKLTAWELGQHGVPHTVIADNAGGHLMQHGQVDLVIVGADRVTRSGYAANKIGTYLKALAAHDNGVPFYVALPSSTFDWDMDDGVREIPIEERGGEEVTRVDGWCDGAVREVRVTPAGSQAANYGFDVTPPRLITGLITDRGICAATEPAIRALFPEHAPMKPISYIKFHCTRTAGAPSATQTKDLLRVRRKLHARRWIGVTPDDIGYGNLSRRVGRTVRFLISGTGTGKREKLTPRDFVFVDRYDLARNRVWCRGALDASAESMTHAAVYEADPRIKAVIHAHDRALWDRLLQTDLPCTPKEAEYGTPAIARAMRKAVRGMKRTSGVVVMGGHEEGLIAFGRTLDEAWQALTAVAD